MFSTFVLLYVLEYTYAARTGLEIKVPEMGPSGHTIQVSWNFPRPYSTVRVTWDLITYVSEPPIQVTSKPLGSTEVDYQQGSVTLSEGLRFDQQHKFCVVASDPNCNPEKILCSYIRVPRSNKVQKGSNLYLVFGPIYSSNITVSWAAFPEGSNPADPIQTELGYRLEWRRVDGKVDGHPGHSSNVVSFTHFVKGLLPSTRYEICVGETLLGQNHRACDIITTEEDLPGPPDSEVSTCHSQVRGTHWRCDVSWSAPKKSNGKIRGYSVSWKDEEGHSLLESAPHGAYCAPFCVDSQVLAFHPSEVCVRAKTLVGYGWESCVKVDDVSSRIIAFFEFRVFMIILATLLIYMFGFRLFAMMMKYCIRCLYRAFADPQKDHPV